MMRIRDKAASGIGSVLEWYDFSLYGFFAPLLAKLYFPSDVLTVGLIKTFSVFAVGFFARPIGALIFGYISDKYGRAISLRITPLLITLPTLLFCFLPTYQQIGFLAPILLIILRIWQGICIGGEYANNIVYLCEGAQKKNLYFMGSIGSCTGSLGILCASLVAAFCYTIFPTKELALFGWRLAFSVSIIIGIFAFIMRINMKETPVFIKVNQKNPVKNPILNSLRNQPTDYILSLGLTFLPATAFYFIFMFLPSSLANVAHSESSKILGDNSFSLFLRLLIIPVICFLSDKIGGVKIARLSSILFLTLSFPIFYAILYYPSLYTFSLCLFAALTTFNAASTPGLLVELLKPETRCTVFSFSFNICFGVFGGITPVIGFLLMNKIDSKIAPVYYLIFAALITLISTFFFTKRIATNENKLFAYNN